MLELDHVEATIRLFDPQIDIRAIGSRPVPVRGRALRGEVTRTVLRSLRLASGPLSSRDIAEVLMRDRGLSPDEKALMVVMTKRVIACLAVQRRKGIAHPTRMLPGRLQGWELVET